jgi:hypothetical protein
VAAVNGSGGFITGTSPLPGASSGTDACPNPSTI